MLNKVILIGNLGNDPEVRHINSNLRVTNLSLATSETWRDKETSEKKTKTEWHRIVVFNESLIKVLENYAKKGSKLYIEGSIQTNKYTDNGVDKYSTQILARQILLLDRKQDIGSETNYHHNNDDNSNNQNNHNNGNIGDDLDDEIPF